MIKITKEKAIELHARLCMLTGGDPGIRDEGLLESALAAPYQTFDGAELYPTLEEKAARLAHSLVLNHAFVDGNKRIGILVMMTFLYVNGKEIEPSSDEVVRAGLSLAAGTMSYVELLEWINKNKINKA